MLMILRILRGVVGFIAIWQIIGLSPLLTNWLANASATTGNTWAIASIKFSAFLICSVAFYWLGRIKKRYEPADATTSELPAIGLALGAVLIIGLAAAIVIPNLSSKSAPQSTSTTPPSQPRAAPETLPYERRAWSGNIFDQFDSVQAIEAKARAIPQLNEQRDWAAVTARQAYFIGVSGKEANIALYMAVDSVLDCKRRLDEVLSNLPKAKDASLDSFTDAYSAAHDQYAACLKHRG